MYKKLGLTLLIITFVLSGCSKPDKPTEVVLEPIAATKTSETAALNASDSNKLADSAETFVPAFEAGACPFNVPEDADDLVECGFVIVLEDHRDPSGSTIRLAVAILKDQSMDHQPDPVILLHGGPGEKTVAHMLELSQILAPLHPNRDLIVFDQRGVGSSDPALECPEFMESYFATLEETDPNVLLESGFDTWMACRDHLVGEGHNLAVYNTTQNAADVEAIRQALGYDQVNLYGASYGSHLAQAVLRDYPEAVRSAVIASVWPLEKSLSVDQVTRTAKAILRLVDACAADADCSAAYPDLREVLFEVIERLNAEPVPIRITHPSSGESYPALLTGDAVVGNLVAFLYLTDVIPVLPQAIYDVYNDNYGLMTQLSSSKLALIELTTRGVLMPTLCSDDLIGYTPEDLLNADAGLPKPFVSRADPELLLEYGIFAICERWPVEEADAWVREPLISDRPILVLGGEFDPVTPADYGRLVADHLSNGYFFEFPGVGHDITANACARSMAGEFVTNPDQEPDSSCIDEMPALAFSVPAKAVEVKLEPYTNAAVGIQGVVPVGWTEVQPGIFARSSPTVDMAVIQIASAPDSSLEEVLQSISGGYGLDSTPEIDAERDVNDLTWQLYTFEVQDVPRDLALAESNGFVMILVMRSAVEEQASLYESVFLPIVDSLTIVE